MRATIANISQLPRQHWGVVTFPSMLAGSYPEEATFLADDGRAFRAVRGHTVGCKTVYRVRATLSGSELVSGTLEPDAHPDAAEFRPHPWAVDYVQALLPDLSAQLSDQSVLWSRDDTPPIKVAWSKAHQRWRIDRRIGDVGLYLSFWIDVLHEDPVLPVWAKVVWSDRTDPQYSREFPALGLAMGEYVAFDFWNRHGLIAPTRIGTKWVQPLNATPITLGDGSGLPLSGNMLAFYSPESSDPPPDPEDVSNAENAGLRDLAAGAYGPVLGVSHDWEGMFLANASLPRLGDGHVSSTDIRWQNFKAMLEQPANWFVTREYGLAKTPGQTGDQHDFGAQKLTGAITEHDPRDIRIAQYSVQAEIFRGYNHYEQDGSPLDIANHPNWVTWRGRTHYHPGVSTDRLGKGEWYEPPPPSGWEGRDDEHDSRQTWAALLALTDDPYLEDQVHHMATTDLAAYRIRYPQYGCGAARAQGRVNGSLVQLASVVPAETRTRLETCLGARLDTLAANHSLQVPGPMKALAWGNPDNRKPIVDIDGNPGRWCSMWEHGLGVVGLWKVTKDTANVPPEWLAALDKACTTLATFGFFNESDRWFFVDDILWSDGEAPPGGLFVGSPHLTSSEGFTSGVAKWTFAGLLVAQRRITKALAQKTGIDALITAMTGGTEARDQRQAEWWAIIDKVPPPPR